MFSFRNLTILFSLFLLTGCFTPTAFRNEYQRKINPDTTYQVTDFNDGFKLDMTYRTYETGGVSAKTTFTARHKIKELAAWIAEARKKKIKPIQIEDVESSHYFNSATNCSNWRGSVRAYYTD
jgi:hypothetical protein